MNKRIWFSKEYTVENFHFFTGNTVDQFLGIEYVEMGDNYLIARMKVRQELKQPFGNLQGGITATIIESVASAAANFCVNPSKNRCFGLEINVNHIKSVNEGYIYAKATPAHLGRSTQVWWVNVTNEKNELTATGRLTIMVKDVVS